MADTMKVVEPTCDRVSRLEKRLVRRPYDKDALMSLADEHYSQRRYKLATHYTLRAIRAGENSHQIQLRLGKCYFNRWLASKSLYDLSFAYAHYKKACQYTSLIRQLNEADMLEFASIFLRMGAYQEALDMLGSMMILYKDNFGLVAVCQYNIAQIMILIEQYDEAFDLYEYIEQAIITVGTYVVKLHPHNVVLVSTRVDKLLLATEKMRLYQIRKNFYEPQVFRELWARIKYGTIQMNNGEIFDLSQGKETFEEWINSSEVIYNLAELYVSEANYMAAANFFKWAADNASKGKEFHELDEEVQEKVVHMILRSAECYAELCMYIRSEELANYVYSKVRNRYVYMKRAARCVEANQKRNQHIITAARVGRFFLFVAMKKVNRRRHQIFLIESVCATKLQAFIRMVMNRSAIIGGLLEMRSPGMIMKRISYFRSISLRSAKTIMADWLEIWQTCAVGIEEAYIMYKRRVRKHNFISSIVCCQRVYRGNFVRKRLRREMSKHIARLGNPGRKSITPYQFNQPSHEQSAFFDSTGTQSPVSVAAFTNSPKTVPHYMNTQTEPELTVSSGITICSRVNKPSYGESSPNHLMNSYADPTRKVCKDVGDAPGQTPATQTTSAYSPRSPYTMHTSDSHKTFDLSDDHDCPSGFSYFPREMRRMHRKKAHDEDIRKDAVVASDSGLAWFQSDFGCIHDEYFDKSQKPESRMAAKKLASIMATDPNLSHSQYDMPGLRRQSTTESYSPRKSDISSIRRSMQSQGSMSVGGNNPRISVNEMTLQIGGLDTKRVSPAAIMSALDAPVNDASMHMGQPRGTFFDSPDMQMESFSPMKTDRSATSRSNPRNMNGRSSQHSAESAPPTSPMRAARTSIGSRGSVGSGAPRASMLPSDPNDFLPAPWKANPAARGRRTLQNILEYDPDDTVKNAHANEALKIANIDGETITTMISLRSIVTQSQGKQNSGIKEECIRWVPFSVLPDTELLRLLCCTSLVISSPSFCSMDAFRLCRLALTRKYTRYHTWSSLTSVFIYSTRLDPDGLSMLIKTLGLCKHLQSLTIGNTGALRDVAMVTLWKYLMAPGCPIRRLYIEREPAVAGNRCLSDLLEKIQVNPTLEHLSIRYCNLRYRGAVALSRYISVSDSLKLLNVSDNFLSKEACSMLITAVATKGARGVFKTLHLQDQTPQLTVDEMLTLHTLGVRFGVRVYGKAITENARKCQAVELTHQSLDEGLDFEDMRMKCVRDAAELVCKVETPDLPSKTNFVKEVHI